MYIFQFIVYQKMHNLKLINKLQYVLLFLLSPLFAAGVAQITRVLC